jgi:hypothetical protein
LLAGTQLPHRIAPLPSTTSGMRTTAAAATPQDLRERLRVSAEPNDTRTPEDTQQPSNNDSLLEEGRHRPDRSAGGGDDDDDDRIRTIFSGVLADEDRASTSPRRQEVLLEVVNNAEPTETDDDDKENSGDGEIGNDDDDPRAKASNVADMAALQDRLRLDGPPAEGHRRLDGSAPLSLLTEFTGSCKGCGTCVPSHFDGVICSNALVARRSVDFGGRTLGLGSSGHYPACGGIWCGTCYGLDESATETEGDGSNTGNSAASTSAGGDGSLPCRNMAARNGDHLVTPFQCELCHFVNIQGRLPNDGSAKDDLLLRNIKRATLDSFWARDDDAVADHCRSLREYAKCSAEMGVTVSLPPPAPVRDVQGMAAAAACVSLVDADDATTGAKKFERASALLRAMRTFEEVQCAAGRGTEQPPPCSVNSVWLERFLDGLHLRLTGARQPPMEPRG